MFLFDQKIKRLHNHYLGEQHKTLIKLEFIAKATSTIW
ncbi:hypothetical protein N500_0270 [Wolbachia pipientis wUni]|nr:hypothetical protein N500_0270 [Wolbachia pipientis wUni]